MKQSYACAHCGHVNAFSRYLVTRWNEATCDRCRHCGAAHAVLRGEVEVISRPMFPIDHSHGVVSPWMLWCWKPIRTGRYECRFRDIEPKILTLWWNGLFFQVSQDDTRRVDCTGLMGWRGVWG